MKRSVYPYQEDFPAGTKVRIKSSAFLEEFGKQWELHHPVTPEHLRFGGSAAVVAAVGFYQGGEAVYRLEGIPGIWHGELLERA